MKRFLAIAAAIVILTAAILTVLPWLVPDSTVRAMAVTRIETITGMRVSEAGDARIRFLPQPQITVDGVRLSLPGGMQAIAAVDRILGRFSLFGFLLRETPVEGLTLVRPRVTVPQNLEASDQWVPQRGGLIRTIFDAIRERPQPDTVPALAADMPATGPVRIVDGAVTIIGADGKPANAFTQIEVAVNWARIGSPLTGNFAFVWNGKVVELDGRIENPGKMLTGIASPIEANIVTAQGNVTVRGASSLGERFRVDGALSVESAAFDQALAWLGYGSGDAPGLDRLSMSGQMRLLGDTANLTGLTVSLDGNTGNGGLTVRAAEGQVFIDGTLALETLNFDRYLRAPAVLDQDSGSGDEVAAVPLPEFGSLRGVDVDLRLSAGQVTGANITFGQTAASLVVRAGTIDLGIGEAAYKDGKVSGNLKITPQPNGKSLSIQTKLNLRQVAVASLFEGGPLFGIEGAINGSIALEGTGYTVEQLVRSLSGDGRMEIQNGLLRGIDVAAIVQSMTSKDFNAVGIRPGLTTPFQTLTIDLVTEGGITRTRTLELVGDRFKATASGKIDLLNEYVDGLGQVQFWPNGRPKPLADGSLPADAKVFEIGFRVDGPLDAPAILPLLPLLKQGAATLPSGG
ncbi:MAG: AsmA family protein [Rhodobiaceae bacterium]|nr:AsmA family protein [Rhodobiaceae bacterium]MCC0054077.1 AsmA family protein [Rhodobiaceae bacterium]